MPVRLETTLVNVKKTVPNSKNSELIMEFYEFMRKNGTGERYQNSNLKAIVAYARFLGPDISFYQVHRKEQVTSFLDSKIKNQEEDPDKRWITTWNDYLSRIKYFFRWLYNCKKEDKDLDDIPFSDWTTPEFVQIKKKKTKRLSPYLENELWEKEDILTLVKYEPYKRNKAILTLLWDLDARPHEITSLKIKHIRLKENYGEGQIPYETKTGGGPILLTLSFVYVRDWLNEHPLSNEPDARLICNLYNGAPINPDSIDKMMKQLRDRIKHLLYSNSNQIKDQQEREKLEYLLKTKKWNPYCIRHSAITADSDYLPEYALKKKVRWSMNSKQGSRYIKVRMGEELKKQILLRNGIVQEIEFKVKPTSILCSRCKLANPKENKYCSKCSYPLKPEAYDELKNEEENRFKHLEEKHQEELNSLRLEMENKFNVIISLIHDNPKLTLIKPKVLLDRNT